MHKNESNGNTKIIKLCTCVYGMNKNITWCKPMHVNVLYEYKPLPFSVSLHC